jgi:hypothetical protein
VLRVRTISRFVPSCSTSPWLFSTWTLSVKIPRSPRLVSRFCATVSPRASHLYSAIVLQKLPTG